VRNAVTPVEVRTIASGKPTVRKAQSLGGNLMTEKRTPAVERQRETGTRWPAPFRLGAPDNRPDTGLMPGRESVLTRSGEPVKSKTTMPRHRRTS